MEPSASSTCAQRSSDQVCAFEALGVMRAKKSAMFTAAIKGGLPKP